MDKKLYLREAAIVIVYAAMGRWVFCLWKTAGLSMSVAIDKGWVKPKDMLAWKIILFVLYDKRVVKLVEWLSLYALDGVDILISKAKALLSSTT